MGFRWKWGSALSLCLFAMVMDRFTDEVRQVPPWTMMFANDMVICSEIRKQVEENVERRRYASERREMKASHSKTEYMCANDWEAIRTVRTQEKNL